MLLLVFYTAAAWSSLFWISGALSFEQTHGSFEPIHDRWPVAHNVWSGFFNPSFWPSLMYRTVAAMAIAALASCVVINVASSLEQQARHELIGHATRFLVPLVLMPLIGTWFLTSTAPDKHSGVLGANVTTTALLGIGIGGSLFFGGYALGVLRYQRFYLDGIAASALCAMALAATAGGEFVRESVRRPSSIGPVLQGSSLHADLAVMNHLFPFGFPWPTALYLTLFIVTAAVYMVFMNYVLAGAIVLLLAFLAPGARKRSGVGPGEPVRSGLGLISQVVRDWLPAVLGLTVTTGIAPLLFVQILYMRQFSTANLFLFNRFVMLLPVLFVACFMLYLVKSQILAGRQAIWRGPVAIVAFACFSFAAWAWTENHVLSLHEESWKHYYTYFPYLYRNAEISPRLGYWLTASFPTLALAVAWQLHWGRRFHDPVNLDLAARRLRSLAILGLAMSAAEVWLWVLWLDTPARSRVLSVMAIPYGLMTLAGMTIQAGGWLPVKSWAGLTTRRLAAISAGNAMTLIGALVVREARRLAAIDIASLFDAHRHAARVGGVSVFLVFLAINSAVIAACVLIVKRALRPLH